MRRHAVRKLIEKVSALLTAAALAEEGVPERARQLVEEAGKDEPDRQTDGRRAGPRAPGSGLRQGHARGVP